MHYVVEKKLELSHKGKPRARQNVVFEHGYLIGRLGRDKVCALVQEGVEIPGDMSGVVYKPLDSAGAWKTSIYVSDTENKLKMLILAPLVRVMEEQIGRDNWISAISG